ncbi:MAG: FeoA family protein [Desulfobacterales bacterium]|jgi:Fe2+ transport system protein FeoA
MMPLTMASEGSRVRLKSVRAGQKLESRLAALGLTPGTEVLIVNNGGNGPFIVEVKGSRLILGRGMAQKIVVS